MWVDDKPVDDGYRSIYMMLIDEMHEFDPQFKYMYFMNFIYIDLWYLYLPFPTNYR